MKKTAFYVVFSLLFISFSSFAAESKIRQFHGSGEVIAVDPVYSQVTIQHGPIKDFVGGDQTDFYVSSASLLKGIETSDLVEFDFTDTKGDVRIDKITKVGVAVHPKDSTPIGDAIQQVLDGSGQVVKGVTEPIPPVHEVAKGATSITDATGEAFKESGTESKTKF